jgi:DUF1365 family protein
MNEYGRLYAGWVVHRRLRPRAHVLRYRVYSLLLDVDRIDEAARALRLFSRNRFNLVSFHDRDHGPGDRRDIALHAREVLAEAGLAYAGARIQLLCYPRVLGFVFNPLSVYYCHDAGGALAALIYEVDNTFGERKSYVLPAGPARGSVHAHECAKELYVSPFAPGQGRYGFRVTMPGDELVVGVSLRDAKGPLIGTHFKARARPLTDAAILAAAARVPLLTLKVVAAIHLEALKLWWKGVPLTVRHTSPRYSIAGRRTTSEN